MARLAIPHGDTRRLPPELDELVRHSAALRRGLAFLHRGPVESVAVTLGVTPSTVDRARALLDRAGERALAIQAFVHAASHGNRGLPRAHESSVAAPAAGPGDLIRLAETRPDGLEVLAVASLEAAAVMFGVHPSLVSEARQALGR